MANSTAPGYGRAADLIDFHQLLEIFWLRKWFLVGIVSVFTTIGIVLVLMLPNVYRAEALLLPNTRDNSSNLSSLASQYGGLASLAGINIGARGSDKAELGIGVLQSRKFITNFIGKHQILVPLMAADGWSPLTKELSIDSDLYNVEKQEWVRDVRPPKSVIPSPNEAYEQFVEILFVERDEKTGFVTVAVEHHSPEIAKRWVDWLVEDLNAVILQEDVTEAEQAVDYLNKQIESTPLAGLRDVFFRLIEEQTKTIMLAKVSEEYVFKTIDPAVIAEDKVRPRRALIVILCIVIGLFVGLAYIGMSSRFGRAKTVS